MSTVFRYPGLPTTHLPEPDLRSTPQSSRPRLPISFIDGDTVAGPTRTFAATLVETGVASRGYHAHFVRWFETTADWLAKPLDIATGTHLFPEDNTWQKQD